jgi:endonuclease III-like uncharacterized protein
MKIRDIYKSNSLIVSITEGETLDSIKYYAVHAQSLAPDKKRARLIKKIDEANRRLKCIKS